METAQKINQYVRQLPEPFQKEILHFVEFIMLKSEADDSRKKDFHWSQFSINASSLITDVENGKVIQLIRHGKPIAQISPIKYKEIAQPLWKTPGLRLAIKGDGLSKAILQEREISA